MTDEAKDALEAAPEVVQPEAEQVEAAEAPESTEGQIDDQPADDVSEPEPSEEKISESKARRERRKAHMAALKEEAKQAKEAKERLQREIDRLRADPDNKPPKMEDFDDHDDYIAAKAAYATTQKMDGRRVKELEREAAERDQHEKSLHSRQQQEARENWAAQADDARTRYADFDAVVTAPNIPITPTMATMLGLSDSGADIAYHLGTNPELASRLSRMQTPELVGAMQMLEQFVSAQVPRPRTHTKAPQPVTPVKAQGSAGKDPEKMTPAEYDKWRADGGTFKI